MTDYIIEDDSEQADKGLMLSVVEARILGALIEKELTVPDTYPLTLNSLTSACNQKSNREPVMNLTEGEVGHTVKSLEDRQLTYLEMGERVYRIEHKMKQALSLSKQQIAVLSVLLLRTPQTLNELKVRTKRSIDCGSLEQMHEYVNELIDYQPAALVRLIAKKPGQREDRYAHLLCGEPVVEDTTRSAAAIPADFVISENDADLVRALQQRIELLEQRVQSLEEH